MRRTFFLLAALLVSTSVLAADLVLWVPSVNAEQDTVCMCYSSLQHLESLFKSSNKGIDPQFPKALSGWALMNAQSYGEGCTTTDNLDGIRACSSCGVDPLAISFALKAYNGIFNSDSHELITDCQAALLYYMASYEKQYGLSKSYAVGVQIGKRVGAVFSYLKQIYGYQMDMNDVLNIGVQKFKLLSLQDTEERKAMLLKFSNNCELCEIPIKLIIELVVSASQ